MMAGKMKMNSSRKEIRGRKTALSCLSKLALACGLALSLASCARPTTVLLCPEAMPLKAVVEAAIARTPGIGKVTVSAEGSVAASGRVVRITTTPGWNLSAGLAPASAIHGPWLDSYSIPQSLAALGQRGKEGYWTSLPILYDVWGQTVFLEKGKSPPLGDWKELVGRAAPGSLSVAGSRPSFRQAAYILELYPELPALSEAAAWFSLGLGQAKAPAQVMPAIIQEKSWLKDTWAFARGDQLGSYRGNRHLVFLETYRDMEAMNPPDPRQFTPLSATPAGRVSSMTGIVLFLEYHGPASDLASVSKLLEALSSDDFQRQAGIAGKWLAASRTAPEIDGTGAMVRILVARSARFFPVTDSLRSPLSADSLWCELQVANASPKK